MALTSRTGFDANGQRVQSVGTPTSASDAVPKSFVRYDISGFATGQPGASEILMDFVSPVAFTLAAALAGSVMVATAAANAAAAFVLKKNGTQIATINFAAGATTATFTMANAAAVGVNDRLQLVAPSTQDSALAGLAFTFAGTR